jgi:hypothetical protein
MINRRIALERISIILGGTLSIQLTAAIFGQVLNEDTSFSVTAVQVALLEDLTEIIIPTTDTLGAKSANVADFIIRVIRDCYPLADQEAFYAGLDGINKISMNNHGKAFIEINKKEKIKIVNVLAESEKALINKAINKTFNKTGFFKLMRELTVTGYFISEIGATQALAYLPIPGSFNGDVPIKPGQKAWAISF